MTLLYVDATNGNNAWNGQFPNFVGGSNGPKATMSSAEALPVAAGDIVTVRGGTYRETLTCGVSGGNLYTSGTVSVVNGSPIVTGAGGMLWLTNVGANYMFHITVLAHGTDGVTTLVTGTSHTFSSAAGNFQAGHVGQTIRIDTIGAYVIKAVAGATSITVAKPDNSSFVMTAGTNLTYDVGPEQPYDILSVNSDTQITLTEPWSGPSFTGLAYATYNPIRYIGDYDGRVWPASKGVPIRLTGSDNDQTATRSNGIIVNNKGYRYFKGFLLDTFSNQAFINATGCTYLTIDNCYLQTLTSQNVMSITLNAISGITIRNCYIIGGTLLFTAVSTLNNAAILVQNCIRIYGITQSTRIGGVLMRNCYLFGQANAAVFVGTALAIGQAFTVNNSIFFECAGGVQATVNTEFIEDYNNFYAVGTNRVNVLTGANSKTITVLPDTRWFFQNVFAGAYPNNQTQFASPFDLSSASLLIGVTGTFPSRTDMRGTAIQGTQREWGALEYDSTLSIEARQAANIDGGGSIVS